MTRLAKTQEAQQGVAFFSFGRSQGLNIIGNITEYTSDIFGPNTDFIRITVNNGCYFKIGENPTAVKRENGSHYLPRYAITPPIPVRAGIDRINIIPASSSVGIWISELE